MKDDFEQKLQRQPLRQIPAAWRKEILASTRNATGTRHSFLSTLNSRLSTLLWPCPQAWAGLAAVWLVIFGVHFATRDETSLTKAEAASRPSPEVILVLKQQQQLRAELVGLFESSDADRTRMPLPRPRSEWRDQILMV